MSTLSTRCGVVTAGLCAREPPARRPAGHRRHLPGGRRRSPSRRRSTPTAAASRPSPGRSPTRSYPHSVKIVPGGTTNGQTTRTMESFMSIAAVSGGFKGAVVTNNTINLVNSFSDLGVQRQRRRRVRHLLDLALQRRPDLGDPDDQGEPVRGGRLAHHLDGRPHLRQRVVQERAADQPAAGAGRRGGDLVGVLDRRSRAGP